MHFSIVGMGASEEATGAAANGQVHHDCQQIQTQIETQVQIQIETQLHMQRATVECITAARKCKHKYKYK